MRVHAPAIMTIPAAIRRASTLVIPPTARYSSQKFLELHDYTARTSLCHALWIIVQIPLPGLISAILPSLLPLQALRYGPDFAFFAHVFCLMVAITCGAIIPVLSVAKIPTHVYSLRQAGLVSVLTGIIHVLLIAAIVFSWNFPIPFMWVTGTTVWCVSVSIAHLIVLRSRCWQQVEIFNSIRDNHRALSLEILQIVCYPALSILFDRVGEALQILITLSFPLVKYLLKTGIRRYSLHLHDQHAAVVVASVEICASLYQSMIMQNAPSNIAIGIIMALDVLQGVVAIKFYLDRLPPAGTSRCELILKALDALRARQAPGSASSRASSPVSVVPEPHQPPAQLAPTTTIALLPQKTNARGSDVVVYRALQFTHAAETIVLLEYFEVMVPILNCVFLSIATQFHASEYNYRIAQFHRDRQQLVGAIQSILMYCLLQAVSWVVLHLVMKHRYGVSATYQLAFTLERHRIPIEAKMAAWLPIILHFTTAHYGTDFSFQFDFKSWEQW